MADWRQTVKRFLLSLTYSPVRYTIGALALLFAYTYIRPFHTWPIYNWFLLPTWRVTYRWDPIIGLMAVGLMLVSFRAFRRYQRRYEENLSSESKDTVCDSPAVRSLIVSLRRRALGLRLASWFILGLTFASIVLGLSLFAAAGDIARGDILSTQLQNILSYSQIEQRELGEQIGKLEGRTGDAGAQAALEELRRLRIDAEARTNALREALQRMEQTNASNERLLFFLSATFTRVGSILLLIFLVQILLSVYRYSVRMVSYYEARADALLLYDGGNAEQLQLFVGTLSAERIGFGKAPQSPAEQALELLKSVSKLQK